MSRHIACKSCRDRKVRCDGEQPSCEKCRRSGEKCVYAPTSTPTRGDLVQTIDSLQERLAKAEAQILEQKVNTTGIGMPTTFAPSMMSEAPILDLQMPFSNNTGSQSAILPPPGGFPPVNHLFSDVDDAAEEFLRSTHEASLATTVIPPLSDIPMPLPPRNSSLPSFKELRAMNDSMSGITSPPAAMQHAVELGEIGSPAVPIVDLVTTMFATQENLAGIAQALAEYLAWAKKSPNDADGSAILEILEARAREMHQMASTRHWTAFKHMTASVEKSGPFYFMLKKLETELIERAVGALRFFHESYDIGKPLAEQKFD
jgi:hypothetical protein